MALSQSKSLGGRQPSRRGLQWWTGRHSGRAHDPSRRRPRVLGRSPCWGWRLRRRIQRRRRRGVAWPWLPPRRLSANLFRRDTAWAGQIDTWPFAWHSGSSVVSSRNFWTLGSRINGLPFPVRTALHWNFTVWVWRAGSSHASSVPHSIVLKSAQGPRLQWCLKPLTRANNRLHMKMRLLKQIPTLSFGSEGHPLIRRFPQLDWNPSIASFRAQTMYLFGQVVTRVRLSCRTLKSTRIRLSQMRGSRDVSLRNILIVGWYM